MIVLGMDVTRLDHENKMAIHVHREALEKAKQILDSARRIVDLAEEAIREEIGSKNAHRLEDSPEILNALGALNMAMVEEAVKLKSHGEPKFSQSLLACGEEQISRKSAEFYFAMKVNRDFIQPLKMFLKKYEEFELLEKKLKATFNEILKPNSMMPKSGFKYIASQMVEIGDIIINSFGQISDIANKFNDAQQEYYLNLDKIKSKRVKVL